MQQVRHFLFLFLSLSAFIDSMFFVVVESCLTDKKRLEKCSTGSCSGRYSTYHENIQSECSSFHSPSTEVHLTVNMIFNEGRQAIAEAKILRYICLFDQCNDQLFTQTFIELVNEYFPLQAMREAFQRPFLNKQPEDTPLSSSSSPSSPFFRPSREQSISFELADLPLINPFPHSSSTCISFSLSLSFSLILSLLLVNHC